MNRLPRIVLVIIAICLGLSFIGVLYVIDNDTPVSASNGIQYIVLAWNDLGMHCYNRDFQDMAILPPYNNLWAQVIQVGDPPILISSGITVTYVFTDNTVSVGKSNFWSYEDALFGVSLPDNIGLTGKGLSGQMDVQGDHFEATGIPLTEFRDSSPSTPYPYQLATIVVHDETSGLELARTIAVAPVSTEMHCDTCHGDYDLANPDIATGKVETNILTLHDDEEETNLMGNRPVLCADCHASNALGKPGSGDVPNFSNAMHDQHKEEVSDSLSGCYNCHPGPQTQCLRDVMSQQGMTCIDCHGTMETVSQNADPWLNEPRCDNSACHGSRFAQDQTLYRLSSEHGGIYCEGCHDSTHAVAPTNQSNDGIKFIALQGEPGTLKRCTVCHATQPTAGGPHGFVFREIFLPMILK